MKSASLQLLLAWLGVPLFASATILCVYSYVIVWAREGEFAPRAVLWNAALFSLFAIHHSVFARASVKQILSKMVSSGTLRPLYVWVSSIFLIVVCTGWHSVGGVIYRAPGIFSVLLTCLQIAGVATIGFGVWSMGREGLRDLVGISTDRPRSILRVVGPYRWVRHPLYLGWLGATFGADSMTGDRFVFAFISAAYILIAIPFEERAMAMTFGADYRSYREAVRWRLVPRVF